jgi:hypothetical protein
MPPTAWYEQMACQNLHKPGLLTMLDFVSGKEAGVKPYNEYCEPRLTKPEAEDDIASGEENHGCLHGTMNTRCGYDLQLGYQISS